MRSSDSSPEFSAGEPTPRAVQNRFTEFDAINEAIPDFDSQYVRLGVGDVDTTLTRVSLDRIVLLRCAEAGPSYLFRATAPAAHSFAFLSRHCGQAVWHGAPAGDHTLVSYAPGSEVVGRSEGPMTWASVMFAQTTLEQHAAQLGFELRASGAAQTLAANLDAIEGLRQAAFQLLAIAESAQSVLDVAEVRRFQEETILTAAVFAARPDRARWEHTALSHRRAVARAVEVLEAHDDEPIYLAGLCKVAGVSERTLRSAFQRIYGVSPIRFLHLHRMSQVRRAILRADPATDRVRDIATRFGFANLGRFAVEFRELFGQSPSKLLREPR